MVNLVSSLVTAFRLIVPLPYWRPWGYSVIAFGSVIISSTIFLYNAGTEELNLRQPYQEGVTFRSRWSSNVEDDIDDYIADDDYPDRL